VGPQFYNAFADRDVAPVGLSSGKVRLRVFVDEPIVEV
jgi:hypothetical protein